MSSSYMFCISDVLEGQSTGVFPRYDLETREGETTGVLPPEVLEGRECLCAEMSHLGIEVQNKGSLIQMNIFSIL